MAQKYPFGKADHPRPAYAAVIALQIANSKTILEPAILTGNLTLNILPDPEQLEGDEIVVKIKATSNGQDTTFGTGIDAPVLIGQGGKTKVQKFVFDGAIFVATGTAVQID